MRNWFFALALLLLAAPAHAAPGSAEAIAAMDAPERDYYLKLFDYMVQNVKPGETYPWQSYSASGEVKWDAPFQAGGTTCRRFHEVINAKNFKNIRGDGMACKRIGRDGWCRLHAGDAATCALEPPSNDVEGAIRNGREVFDKASERARTAKFNWWPF